MDDCIVYSPKKYRETEGIKVNSAHSYAYSHLTAITAYLSANYPLEFFTAALTIDSDNTDDVRKYILALKERGLSILPPSINKSKAGFEIVDGTIIFGLSAIKGVGKTISNTIIKNRPKGGYISFGHFVNRNISILNKKVLDSYTKAGVFSEFGYSKNTILNSVDNILELMSDLKSNNKYTMLDILDVDMSSFIEASLVKYSNKPDNVYYECDAIGMYISKHPMEEYVVDKKILQSIDDTKAVDEDVEEFKVKTVGVITGISIRKTKQKSNMAEFLFTDKDSSIKAIAFPKIYNQFIDEFVEGRIAIVDGTVRYDNDERVIYIRSISLYQNSSIGLMKKMSSNKVLPKKNENDIIIHSVGKLKFKLVRKD